MGLISNGTTLLDAGSLSVSAGAMTLLSTVTASSGDSTITFASSINSTYKEYIFKFIDVHLSANARLLVNFRDGSTDYDATKTTTFFEAYHYESDSSLSVGYVTDYDLAQSTGAHTLAYIGNGNDEASSGTLHLYDPASTTFVKNFMSVASCYHGSDLALQAHSGGYCNVTAAIDGVQFSANTGTIDAGVFKMYGVS
jgi:hypothetical protein|tara:strand:- start:626 stop:1216 length:591 start_codon:yes stop_codon:yes gene_type:complete